MILKNRSKIILAIVISLAILLVFNLPTYLGYIFTPKGTVFSGQAFAFDPWDINVYVAAIKWAQIHGFEYQNAFTTVPHKSVMLYPLYTTIGFFLPRVDVFLIYNALIITFGLSLLIILYKFIKVFSENFLHPAVVLLTIAFAGGIEWVAFIFFRVEPNGINTIYYTFQNMLQRPHTLLAFSLYLISLSCFFIGITTKSPKHIKLSIITFIASCLIYPYNVISFYVVTTIFSFIYALRSKSNYPIKYLIKHAIFTIPPVSIYSIYLLLNKGAFSNVFNPDALATFNFKILVTSTTVYLPFVVYQLVYHLRKGNFDNKNIFLNIWLISSYALAFIPISFSRYFIRGMYVPVVILTFHALYILSKNHKHLIKVVTTLVIIIGSLTSVYFLYLRITVIDNPNNQWYYISKDRHEALQYLNNNTIVGSGVIADYPFSNQIPTYTHNRVYFGHNFQSPGSESKKRLQEQLFDLGLDQQSAKNFIFANNINYVVWPIGKTRKPDKISLKYSFLKLIFENENYYIFKINSN
jgi:hypothetical protein